MVKRTIEEIAAKMASLDAWKSINGCSWALRPAGSALPYFCCCAPGEKDVIRERIMLLEGWQTFHDFVRIRVDPDFAYWSTPMEMPHYELIFLTSGPVWLMRHDPGYAPCKVDARGRALCEKMFWEVYGVMMRLESDRSLVMRYAEEQAIFSRREESDGTWVDAPLTLLQPNPYVEKIALPKKMVSAVKDVPMQDDVAIEVDMRIVPGIMTCEKRPRIMYLFAAADAKTGKVLFEDKLSISPEEGLRGLWEGLAVRLLAHFEKLRFVPGEVRVSSGRLYRFLRPLCCELPFRLVKCPQLAHIAPVVARILAQFDGNSNMVKCPTSIKDQKKEKT